MTELTLLDLDAASQAFDDAVLAGGDTDRFCSASHWILPAHGTVSTRGEPWIRHWDEGWVALVLRQHRLHGRVLGPLETMWGFACPFVGPGLARLATRFADDLLSYRDRWDTLWLHGIPPGAGFHGALAVALAGHVRIGGKPTTLRNVASLEGGLDGYLSRRTRSRRKALRRGERLSRLAGVELELHRRGDHAELFGRIQAVELSSWKGRQGVGIEAGRMKAFYEAMLPRLERTGRLRLVFATLEDRDVAYCLGGVFGGTLRGLQQSYDPAHAKLSLGPLCQHHLLRGVCEDGDADRYDLGMDKDYKRSWAERQVRTLSVVSLPKRSRG